MIRKYALVASTSLALLAGCGGSGDIEINPTTVDNSVNNSNNTVTDGGSGGTTNPCASYVTQSGQTRQGTYDGTNCTYSPAFADSGNNILVDLTFDALPNGGAHVFQGSLFMGVAANSDAELSAANISQGGDGPTLFIEAGATLAWQSNLNFLTINRGSQIFAVGRADAPITLTSLSDVNGDLAANPEAVQQWGGVVINGFGVTNKCSYTGTRGTAGFALDGECHVASEGSAGLDENFYGGANDDDSSGRLEYVIVKHTGATVGNGDELNGITFGGVGRNTVVRNLQVYSTFDDGIEMFGGAVEFENFAALYVRDDSIDIDEGWIGSIDGALVIQQESDGNHCIEADGIGSFSGLASAVVDDFVARGLNSAPTISNMTCIFSPNDAATATHDPGRGLILREGIEPTLRDILVLSSFGVDSADDNYCFRPQDQGTSVIIERGIFACQDLFAGDGATVAPSLDAQFATLATATDPTSAADTDLVLLEIGANAGETAPIFSVDFANMVVDGAAPTVTAPAGGFLGVLNQGESNPFTGWTFGIFEDNRAQPLWFE